MRRMKPTALPPKTKATKARAPNAGCFQRGPDSKRSPAGSRLGELPEPLAVALESRLPGVCDDVRRTVRDAVKQGQGLSAVGKHCARMAAVWSSLVISELSKGNTDIAFKASREAEVCFRRLAAEVEASLAKKARRELHEPEEEPGNDGADDDDSSAEVAAILERFQRPSNEGVPSGAPDGATPDEPSSESNLPLREGGSR